MASEEHSHYDCSKDSVLSEHVRTDKEEQGYLLGADCNEQTTKESASETDNEQCQKTKGTAFFDPVTQNQNVNESEHCISECSVTSLTSEKVQSDKGNLGYENQVKVLDGSKSLPDNLKGISSQKAGEHLNTSEATLTRLVSESVPAVGVKGTGGSHVIEDKDSYQDIAKSEVSSLDDWEHLHKSCLMEIPPIDPGALHEIEKQAREVARDLDHMLGSLASHMTAITKMDAKALGVYNTSIDHVSSTVDKSVKGMYTLIAKCEELNSNMEPVSQIAAQIKEIKRTLDVFEAMCK